MNGPIRFVFTILWLGIALATLGTLKDCTLTMAGKAIDAQTEQLSLKKWNKKLVGSSTR